MRKACRRPFPEIGARRTGVKAKNCRSRRSAAEASTAIATFDKAENTPISGESRGYFLGYGTQGVSRDHVLDNLGAKRRPRFV
jgi:hypothetical protein